jgi:hypothetical protein
MASTEDAAPSFDFLSSIFSGIEIEQNGVLVSQASTLYPYRAHIVKLLTYDYGYKTSNAQEELWYSDTVSDDFGTLNLGYGARLTYSTTSKAFEVTGRLSEAIFEEDK